MLGDACRCAFHGQRRRAQPIYPRFGPADADHERCAHTGSVPARSFLSSLSSRLQSDPTENKRIDLNEETLELLKRVNHSVNISIIPTPKSYGQNLRDRWTIAPDMGDCNDYAVTKRHQLIENGLPSKALRLAAVKTASGIGHLVLVVVTTKVDIVMDDLTEVIRPWQSTDYHWLKIQSATDSKFWYEVKVPAVGPSVSQAD
jgi:predicted transglutaminase-like cysteine proteinase